MAQWGLVDRITGDPGVWLCHQCGECNERCPRDARPGDVLQSLRSKTIEMLAFPGAIGRLVANARWSWPILIGVPWLFWLLLWGTGALHLPAGPHIHAYEEFVPHGTLYAVYFPVAGWALLAAIVGGLRFWRHLGEGAERRGSFLSGFLPAMGDVLAHKSFGSCERVSLRRWAHLALFWGFVGAAVTSGLLVWEIYVTRTPMPLPLGHPWKILGNISAALLVVGGVMLVVSRFGTHRSIIKTSAFDGFFLGVVALVIATGVLVEAARFALPPTAAALLYTLHLGVVLTLFLTFPYSKFAHMLYRTLALVHQRLTAPSGQG
jgi:quinone-modifying oxidoreductase subunit QmoC